MKTGELRSARGLIIASSVAAALLFGVTASASAGTLDQQQTAFDFDAGVTSSESLAQTFTPGITGRLDQVDLVLDKFFGPVQPINIELRNVTGGLPVDAVLATTSIPASAIGGTAALVPATFSAPASVTAGTPYAIVAWTADTTGNYGWSLQQSTNPYQGGAALNSQASPPGNDWNGPPGDDQAFKTYVVPSPPASPVPSRKRCKKHRKKHKSGAQIAKKKCKKKRHRH
jgi:hypothetical protein